MTAKRTWFPEVHQMVFDAKNEVPYGHSVWVGLTAPMLNMPVMLWRGVIVPPIHGIFFIIMFCLGAVMAGFRGHLSGQLIKMPKISIEVVNNKE